MGTLWTPSFHFALIFQALQQFPCASIQCRMPDMRRNFRQGLEHKSALVQTWVRQHEELCMAFNVAVKEQVEIDCARSIFDVSDAPQRKFNS